jgi:hypothetical protein
MSTQTPSITPTPIAFSCVDCADGRRALAYVCPLASDDETARALLDPYGEIREATQSEHTCLYVVKPGPTLSYLYYVDLATSTVTLSIIDPGLLSPTETTTPQ